MYFNFDIFSNLLLLFDKKMKWTVGSRPAVALKLLVLSPDVEIIAQFLVYLITLYYVHCSYSCIYVKSNSFLAYLILRIYCVL